MPCEFIFGSIFSVFFVVIEKNFSFFLNFRQFISHNKSRQGRNNKQYLQHNDDNNV